MSSVHINSLYDACRPIILFYVSVAELSTVDTLSLVHCTSTACLLLVNASVFVSIKLLDDGLCKHVATLAIPGASHSCPPLFQIVADQLVVLAEKTETLCILSTAISRWVLL